MTYEQLTNWILTAGLYVVKTEDQPFLQRFDALLRDAHESLENRDDPDPLRRTGIMGCDSSRTGKGAEITTYDSLDQSLGQARGNLYLAVKTWAAYLALEEMYRRVGRPELSVRAGTSAERTAGAIVERWNPELGYLPAVFDGNNTSAILPAIEALVYPKSMGLHSALDPKGRFAVFLSTLRRHFEAVFKPGICQFEDGGWKLSSTSSNSWMSKIAIAQYVARTVLAVRFSPRRSRATTAPTPPGSARGRAIGPSVISLCRALPAVAATTRAGLRPSSGLASDQLAPLFRLTLVTHPLRPRLDDALRLRRPEEPLPPRDDDGGQSISHDIDGRPCHVHDLIHRKQHGDARFTGQSEAGAGARDDDEGGSGDTRHALGGEHKGDDRQDLLQREACPRDLPGRWSYWPTPSKVSSHPD